MTTTPRPISALDVPLSKLTADLRRLLAKQRVDAAAERLRELIAHPESGRQPAEEGLRAEYRHLLHDCDPDSTVPAIRADLTKQPGRAS
jgi:hypothetical protein